MFWERTSGGSEEGDGKNLHFQQAHVKAMRFLAAPTRSSTGPSRLRESMRQALTLVRQVQCDRVCFQETRVIDAHWAVVGGLWQRRLLREPCESCVKHCGLVFPTWCGRSRRHGPQRLTAQGPVGLGLRNTDSVIAESL